MVHGSNSGTNSHVNWTSKTVALQQQRQWQQQPQQQNVVRQNGNNDGTPDPERRRPHSQEKETPTTDLHRNVPTTGDRSSDKSSLVRGVVVSIGRF
jgi:sRNA-binding protein